MRKIIEFMREQNGEHQIVEMVANDFEKLKDLRSFKFDPLTYLTVKGTQQTPSLDDHPTKYLQMQKRSKILTTPKAERYLIELE